MVNVNACNIKHLRCGEMIYLRLYAIRMTPPVEIKILGNKLLRLFVFAHDLCLPAQILSNQQTLELCKLSSKACINTAVNRRKIIPVIDPVAPVIKAENFIQAIQ